MQLIIINNIVVVSKLKLFEGIDYMDYMQSLGTCNIVRSLQWEPKYYKTVLSSSSISK